MRFLVTFFLAILIAIVFRTNVGGDLAVVAAATVLLSFGFRWQFGFGKTVIVALVLLCGLEALTPHAKPPRATAVTTSQRG